MRYSFEDFDFSRLSPPERLLLAQELLDSVYDVLRAGGHLGGAMSHLQARSDDLRSGRVQGVAWEQAKAISSH